jgi:hypothetical protein
MNLRFLILLVILLVASGAFYLWTERKPVTLGPEGVPELASLAPANSTSLLYVDAVLLRQSTFLSKLIDELEAAPMEDADYVEFVRASGFDYTRDLARALLAQLPGDAASRGPSTFAVAEGRFDRARIAAYALKSGRAQKRESLEVFTVTPGQPPRATHFMFLRDDRVAVSNASEPFALFSAAAQPTALPDEMRRRIARVGGAAVFAIARAEKTPDGVALFGYRSKELQPVLKSAEWISLATRPEGERLKVALEAECATPQAAAETAQSLQALLLLGRFLLDDPKLRQQFPPRLLALLQFLTRNSEVRHAEQRVQIRLDIPAEVLRSMVSATPGK